MKGAAERDALSMQIVASLRREEFFTLVRDLEGIGPHRADPKSASFDPERAVARFLQMREFDDAAWLIFLMVYLAKPEEGWTRLKDIYGALGQSLWNWAAVSADPPAFEEWLSNHWMSVGGKFGNHRKYESLDPASARPMGAAATQYITWVLSKGSHQSLFTGIIVNAGNNPHDIFDAFFHALPVQGFGRLGRFDWVAMLARYRMIPAKAGSAYLAQATGPKAGARLLFDGNAKSATPPKTLQAWLDELDHHLGVGMEVLEDAICNWQKSPAKFVHFKG